ncbi:hypothetical protein JHW43_006984 [Diplocarpon mali]|nr:hypothetical protein JHW43_006984 [Diplocarpon mali]
MTDPPPSLLPAIPTPLLPAVPPAVESPAIAGPAVAGLVSSRSWKRRLQDGLVVQVVLPGGGALRFFEAVVLLETLAP